MSDSPYIVQKVEWYQFRAADGKAFFVMVSSLPNGFVTAVPCQVSLTMADHSLMALAATPDEALTQLQATLAGKTQEQIFAHEYVRIAYLVKRTSSGATPGGLESPPFLGSEEEGGHSCPPNSAVVGTG